MTFNPGPTYQEWLDVISHSTTLGFEDLQAMAQRIEEDPGQLTKGQRAELLRKLGDMQVAAAKKDEWISA